MRYHIKEKTLSLVESLTVRDDADKVVFEIHGKVLRIGHNLTMRDCDTGEEIIHIKQHVVSLLPHYDIYRSGKLYAKFKEEFRLKESFMITTEDGKVFNIVGNIKKLNFAVNDEQGNQLAEIKSDFALINGT